MPTSTRWFGLVVPTMDTRPLSTKWTCETGSPDVRGCRPAPGRPIRDAAAVLHGRRWKALPKVGYAKRPWKSQYLNSAIILHLQPLHRCAGCSSCGRRAAYVAARREARIDPARQTIACGRRSSRTLHYLHRPAFARVAAAHKNSCLSQRLACARLPQSFGLVTYCSAIATKAPQSVCWPVHLTADARPGAVGSLKVFGVGDDCPIDARASSSEKGRDQESMCAIGALCGVG